MRRHRSRSRRIRRALPLLPGLVVAVVAAAVTPAYASSGSGPRPGGEGQAAISGYAVSNVQWQLVTGDSLASVTFRLSPPSARSAQVRVIAGGSWSSCSVADGAASCLLPAGTSVAAADQLSVVAF